MLSPRILRRLAYVAAAGALTVATSHARTFIPTSPQAAPAQAPAQAAPSETRPETRPVTRPARPPAKKQFATADSAACPKVRQKLFVEGEGWIVRSVTRCG